LEVGTALEHDVELGVELEQDHSLTIELDAVVQEWLENLDLGEKCSLSSNLVAETPNEPNVCLCMPSS
jgi:hypothetical protein